MKALAAVLILFGSLCHVAASAQNSSEISSRALKYADSLTVAFEGQNWNRYVELSYPGVVKYYGGRKGFETYAQRCRQMVGHQSNKYSQNLAVTQIMNVENEWQCILKKTSAAIIDHRKATVITYLVGQSTDGGSTWKYVDVALNPAGNIIYIMPDIFESLIVPQREIIFEKTELAQLSR